MLVPDEALGALKLEAILTEGEAATQSQGLNPCGFGHRARGGAVGLWRALLWAATHSTLPSEATHFSRPHCISLESLHCPSTCAREMVRQRRWLYGATRGWRER